MVKLAIGELSASEILAASQNPGTRTYLSFMGKRPKRIVAAAAPWKGMDMRYLQANHPGVARGISTASKLSQAHREKGVAVVSRAKGGVTVVPLKCGMMMEDAGSGKIMRRIGSIDQAIQQGLVSIRA